MYDPGPSLILSVAQNEWIDVMCVKQPQLPCNEHPKTHHTALAMSKQHIDTYLLWLSSANPKDAENFRCNPKYVNIVVVYNIYLLSRLHKCQRVSVKLNTAMGQSL